jgi:hypothetical protein
MVLVAYEMNITRAEFERLLPAAVGFAGIESTIGDAGGEYSGCAESGRWRIRLGPARERCLGLIRIPLRDVEILVDGLTEAQAHAFRRRFDLYFQKGGG